MRYHTLNDLYVSLLRDLYSAEQQLLIALPVMAQSAVTPKLKEGFEVHLTQTQEHVKRLEKIFSELGESPLGKVSGAMLGLVREGNDIITGNEPGIVRDAALIMAAQRVEHLEIASYGTAATYAGLLGEEKAVKLLETTLKEEEETDQQLTVVASAINPKAV